MNQDKADKAKEIIECHASDIPLGVIDPEAEYDLIPNRNCKSCWGKGIIVYLRGGKRIVMPCHCIRPKLREQVKNGVPI